MKNPSSRYGKQKFLEYYKHLNIGHLDSFLTI
jgi:hypothetical protein